MSKGRLLATLLATLDFDVSRFKACVNVLKRSVGATIGPGILRNHVIEGREYLAFETLVELGVIQWPIGSQAATGSVQSGDLDWLIRDGQLVVDALRGSQTTEQGFQPQAELAWTIPESVANVIELEPSAQSLAGLLRYAISRAQHRLIVVSPFLERQGLVYLEPALKGASDRGVEVLLISHGLQEPGSPGREASDYLRSAVRGMKCFTTSKSSTGSSHVLVHSKVVIADEDFVVLSSANLTKYGLANHLEIGVGLSGEAAADLAALFTQVIETDLVEPIP